MSSRIAKYIQIKSTFIQQIQSGVYKPGDTFPSDNELMRSLNVSKSTITQALKELSSEGYITRQQGKGTFVNDIADKKTSLSLYICPMEKNEEVFWNEIVREFNEQNSECQIQITFLTNDSGPLRDILFQGFASGNGPDLFSLDGPDVPYWAYMNSLLPLESYLDAHFLDSFLPQILQQGAYNGHLYHLGYTESTLCIIYNKQLFKGLNIRIPEDIFDSWTWEEFLGICKLLKKKTDYPYPLLMDSGRGLSTKSGEWGSYMGVPFILQNNGRIFDPTLTTTSGNLDSEPTVQAMSWMGDLFHKYHYTHLEPLRNAFPENFAMSLSLPVPFPRFKRDG